MHLEWKDTYLIGHADIDAQHQELFKRAQDLLSATSPDGQTLSAMRLYQYTRGHFAHEEGLMRSLNYPDINTHIRQHNDLLERLTAISQDIAGGTLKKPDLEQFVTFWLLTHMATYDTLLAAYVRS